MSISFALVAPVDDMAALPISCPLCCEDKPLSAMVLLSKCSHESCKDCITKWIEKTEASGHQMTQPTCPFCRLELTEEETFAILGRSFQPAASANSSTPAEVEADELTLQWLQEQTRPCPHCGALIEKEEGCDLMECLCGFRFCYGCGSQGAQCSCTPANHVFYDNIIGRNAGRGAQEGAAVDEQTGLVDLLAHIERRKRQERAAQVRREREIRRQDEEWERMEAEKDGFTLSAKWLFFTSSQKGLRVLQQQMRAGSVREARRGQRRTEERERRMIHEAISNGAWLFQIKIERRKRQERAAQVRREREIRRQDEEWERISSSTSSSRVVTASTSGNSAAVIPSDPNGGVGDVSSSSSGRRGSASSSGAAAAAANARNDSEWQKVRHKQQRLLLLRHASKCKFEPGQCPVTPHCASMKKLWEHIAHCKDHQCTVQHCMSSRYVLSHYRRCKDPRCLSCGPVRDTIRKASDREKARGS